MSKPIFLLIFVVLLPLYVVAQAVYQDPSLGYGVTPYQTYLGENENINLGTGSLNVKIPILKLPGRNGHNIDINLSYNSQPWYVFSFTNPLGQTTYSWATGPYGWSWNIPSVTSETGVPPNSLTMGSYECTGQYRLTLWDGRTIYFPSVYSNCYWINPNGANSPAPGQESLIGTSGAPFGSSSGCVPDRAVLTVNDGNSPYQVNLPSGEVMWFNAASGGVTTYLTKYEDANGNIITFSGNTITDTLGRTVTGAANGLGQYSGTVTYSDSNNNPQTITLTTEGVTFTPNFPTNLAGEENQTQNWTLLSSVVLPNGDQWTMQYSPDSTGHGYGELTQITYPTGGFTSYSYEFAGRVRGDTSGNTNSRRQVVGKQTCRDFNTRSSGTCSHTDNTTITPTAPTSLTVNTSSTVIDAVDDQTVYTFDSAISDATFGYETERQIYSGTSTLLRTVQTTPTCFGPYQVTTTLNDNKGGTLTSQENPILPTGPAVVYGYQYQSPPITGVWTSTGTESDYGSAGSGKAGSLLRQTVTTWLTTNSVNGQDYTKLPIYHPDLKLSEIIENGSGTTIAQTNYEYDNYSTTPPHAGLTASGATQHDSAYSTTYTTRSNVTATSRWLNANNTWLPTTNTYDDAGNVLSSTDPNSNTTSFSYADNFTDGTNHNAMAYVTKTIHPPTNGVSHIDRKQYYFNTGLASGSCGENFPSATTCTNTAALPEPDYANFSYDSLGRLLVTNFGDTGQTSVCYSDDPGTSCSSSNPQLSQTTTTLITSSTSMVNVALLDGVGHTIQTQLTSDPSGTDYVDTTYDGVGRKISVSNPHRSTSNLTDGTTEFEYDGLNRTILVTEQDESKVVTAYAGNVSTVTDEVGNQRSNTTDGLGRLTSVDEPSSSSAAESASATVTISGNGIKSYTTTAPPPAPGTGNVTISGNLRCFDYCPPMGQCSEIPDAGTVTIIVNGVQQSTSYSGSCSSGGTQTGGDTPTMIAQRLAGYLTTTAPGGVTATANSGSCGSGYSACTIYITANENGTNTDYSLSATSVTTSTYFSPGSTSFPAGPSGSALTGGETGPVTTYDAGTVSATIGDCNASAPYSQSTNSTASTVASALAANINTSCSTLVSANAVGSVITVTVVDPGSAGNGTTLSVTSSSNYPQYFSPPSFTDSSTSFAGGANGGITTPLVTQYSYDPLNDLTCAVQQSTLGGTFSTCAAAPTTWRPRSFVYDSLGRLASATNPESGTISYSYDSDSNVLTKTAPSPNQPPTGTAQVTTTYTYDALNRLTGKSYKDNYATNPTTPSAVYGYDAVAISSCPAAKPPSDTDSYPIGRRTAMCDGSGAASWIHDTMGRILQERRTIGSVSGDYETDAYNLNGSPTGVTSLGYEVVYSYDKAGRAVSAINYSGGTNNLITGATYAPPGELTGMTMGSTSNFSGIVTNNAYSNRLQPIFLSAGVNGQSSVFSLCFDFHLGVAVNAGPCSFSASSAGDNGNVYQIVNTRNPSRSENFNYDALNRIQQAYSTGSIWGETFGPAATSPGVAPSTPGIDAWGNLTNRSGVTGKPSTEPLSTSAGTNNQLSGYTYDPAGNMTSTGSATYFYDAENRLIGLPSSGYSYIYDGDGQRVEKCTPAGTMPGTCASGATGTLYWRGNNSAALSETNLAGTVQNTYIFFNGQRVARRDSTGLIHYYFSDQVGSHGVVESVNTAGVTLCEQDIDYYPYGGVQSDYCSGAGVPQNYKFTGKERDSESGLDNFGARYNASTMGRFMTPDWAAKATAVPYAVFGNPQSLNLYSYVLNNPLSRVDPDGHYDVTPSNCGDNSKCQKKYDKAADKFEKRREKDLNSKKADVRAAAANYGERGEVNGVHVGFANLASQGINGSVDASGSTPGNQNIQVTLDFGRAGNAETQTHEGTHVGDDQKFLNSYDPATGGYNQALNPTHGQTEFNAFKAGAEINHEHGFGPNDAQKILDFLHNSPVYGPIFNVPVFDPNNFPAGAPQ
jgi:RHS repeat-associated protein